jgi:hypothetical protein
MAHSLARLTIDELILHEVPRAKKRDSDAEAVQVSGLPVELTQDHKAYLQERFRADLAKNAREVTEGSGHSTSVPRSLKQLLLNPSLDFVGPSQEMAHQLRTVQGGNSPSGLLMIARCTLAGSPAVLLAKVELEQGVRAQAITRSGKSTYDMEVIRDLVFGETSEIFKAGLFSAADIDDVETPLRGLAIDRQKSGPSVTRFFLFDYLGCEYVADAGESTRRFYESARKYINANVADPAEKAKYILALAAEMDSNRREIEPRAFARDHLDNELVPGFLDALGQAGAPVNRFPKSDEYIATKLVRFETEDHIIVVADRDQVDSGMVEVTQEGLTVHDHVASVETRGPRGTRANAVDVQAS